jgi:DNA repair exonuclease SbcCD nuclease subunit
MMEEKNKKYWIVLADCQLGAIHWQSLIREADYYTAFQTQCLNAAQDKNCLGIIGLGDLREKTTIAAKSLGGLNRGLKILWEAKKPLLALMGNHDKTDPNWIKEMHYPSLKDLTDPKIQSEFGFDPETTLALHYTHRASLLDSLLEHKPKNKRVVFLHQSIRELTTHILQSYDLSLEELSSLGFGKEHKCLVLMGDLHNYGDVSFKNIELAYPGSLEMTDINEGVNGLKSQRIQSGPHDYRKFVIHYYPNSLTWEPVEIDTRPWFRGKAKTERECQDLKAKLEDKLSKWQTAGCILLTVPKKEINIFKDVLSEYPILEARVEQYDPLSEGDEDTQLQGHLDTSLSWKENKKSLLNLAEENGLAQGPLDLLNCLVHTDGSGHNSKADINQAWENWKEGINNDT